MQWVMFSKPLQHLALEPMAERIASMGFEGVDLTVRGGGHVDTKNSSDPGKALVEAAAVVRAAGLSMPMIATNITDASEPHAEAIFHAAAEAGVGVIKLGYYNYEGFDSLARAIDEAQRKLDGLTALAERAGVCAGIHNHSGERHLSASPSTVAMLLAERNPEAIGAYVDIGHLVAEGLAGSWVQGLDLLADRVAAVGFKSYGFVPDSEPDAQTGVTAWRRTAMAYDQGSVPWPRVLSLLGAIGFDGPASFHCEYAGEPDEALAQLANDRRWLAAVRESVEAGA